MGTTVKLKGGPVGSVKELKVQLKKGSGKQFFTRIGDEPLLVRIMDEPDTWIQFINHWDEVAKMSFPCTDDCPGCKDNLRKSKVYLTNAVDLDQNKSVPLQLPLTVAKLLLKFYDKYGTLLDRDYELSKEGTGLDTEYAVMPEGTSKVDLRRYDRFDLWSMVEGLWEDYAGRSDDDEDDDDEDDDDEVVVPAPRRAATKPAKSVPAKKRPTRPVRRVG